MFMICRITCKNMWDLCRLGLFTRHTFLWFLSEKMRKTFLLSLSVSLLTTISRLSWFLLYFFSSSSPSSSSSFSLSLFVASIRDDRRRSAELHNLSWVCRRCCCYYYCCCWCCTILVVVVRQLHTHVHEKEAKGKREKKKSCASERSKPSFSF